MSSRGQDPSKNFNVLLNLYKMNPLKESNIYKSFSQHTLSRGVDENSVPIKLESNEKERERTRINLKQIEQIIHHGIKRPDLQSTEVRNPDYDVNNVDTEKFNIDIFKIASLKTTTEALRIRVKFNGLFENVESDEFDKISTTERNSNKIGTESRILHGTKSLSTTDSTSSTIQSLESNEFETLVEETKKRNFVQDENVKNNSNNRLLDSTSTTIKSLESNEFDKLVEGTNKRNIDHNENVKNNDTNRFLDIVIFR